MSSAPRVVDLTQVSPVPWAWVDEHVYAAIRGCSVKLLQHERRLNVGCPFRRINGTTIRYKIGDIDFHGIAAWRRWRREAVSSGEERPRPPAQILDLTVSGNEVTNGVPRRVGIADQRRIST
jgi:hypothetical protein